MAADYRHPAARHGQLGVTAGEFGFVVLATELYVGENTDDVASDRTLRLTFSLGNVDSDLKSGWLDDKTQTRTTCGRASLTECLSLVRGQHESPCPPRLILVCVEGELSVPLADIDALTRQIKEATGVPIVVVGGTETVRRALTAADGYIIGEPCFATGIGADAAHTLHTALNAAFRLSCLDLEDLLTVTGSAGQPAIMMRGVWRRDQVPDILISDDASRLLSSEAPLRMLLSLRADRLNLSEVRALSDWVLSFARSSTRDLLLATPHDVPSSSILPRGFGTIDILARRI